MVVSRFGKRIAKHPDLLAEFYYAASEIVDDFDDWGPVLQANEASVHDDSSPVQRLRVARAALIRAIGEVPPEE